LAGEEGVDLLRAEQAIEAGVATRLLRQKVGVSGATPRRAPGAVDREADEIGLSLRSCGRACRGRGRGERFRELRRRVAEDLRHVAAWTGARVLQHDVGGGDGPHVAAGTSERNPRRRNVRPIQPTMFGMVVVAATGSVQ
jgi:hypothetical protein